MPCGCGLWSILCCVSLLGVVAPATAQAATGDWPQFHNGAAHTGYNAQEHILTASNVHELGVAWTGTTGGINESSPAVANGVVYVGADDGLYAFAVGCASGGTSCTPLWTGTTGDAIISSPAVADGVVYVGSTDGKLYAFAVGCAGGGASCAPLWTGTAGNHIYSSPTVAGGVVYVGSADGTLSAFDAAGVTGCSGSVPNRTCTPLWTGTTGDTIYSSATVAGGVVYVGSQDGKLYAFAVGCASGGGSCSPVWTGTTDYIASTPAVANGVVYVGSADGNLYAFAVGCAAGGATCTPLWTGATGDAIDSSPAVANGVVYVGSLDASLYAFDAAGVTGCTGSPKTCAPLWTGATGDHIMFSSPAVANGVVYIGSADGNLYAFAVGCAAGGATCTPLWTGATGSSIDSSPAVANGLVYVGSNDGKLYAFGLDHTAPVVTRPMPSFSVPSTLGSGSTRVSWSAADGSSGVASCQLQRKIGTGSFSNVALPSPSLTSLSVSLSIGTTYQFRVRATDGAGNTSAWVTGPAFKPVLFENTNLNVHYTGSWHLSSTSSASGGSTKYATAAGARARLTFTGRSVAYVAPTGPTRGSARIYVDGNLVATINLHASAVHAKRVVFAKSWSNAGSHTIMVKVVGTAGHPRVDLDAFLTLK